jgi:hypothetical protein
VTAGDAVVWAKDSGTLVAAAALLTFVIAIIAAYMLWRDAGAARSSAAASATTSAKAMERAVAQNNAFFERIAKRLSAEKKERAGGLPATPGTIPDMQGMQNVQSLQGLQSLLQKHKQQQQQQQQHQKQGVERARGASVAGSRAGAALRPTNIRPGSAGPGAATWKADVSPPPLYLGAPSSSAASADASARAAGMREIQKRTFGDGAVRKVEIGGMPVPPQLVKSAIFENAQFMPREEAPQKSQRARMDRSTDTPAGMFGPMQNRVGPYGLDVVKKQF